MEEFKGTKIQHYVDNDDVTNYVFCDENGNHLAATLETAERNTKIFNEAFSVVTRTGLTPEQMEKRISDLEARLKEVVELIQVSDSIVDDLMLGLPGIRSQIELSDLRKRFDSFLKEKTK